MDAAGGASEFLDDHAVIVMSDHSQNLIESSTNLAEALAGRRILLPADPEPDEAEIAVCPGARSAQVYVLDEARRADDAPRIADELREVEGVDLVVRREGDEGVVCERARRAALRARRRADRRQRATPGAWRATTRRWT